MIVPYDWLVSYENNTEILILDVIVFETLVPYVTIVLTCIRKNIRISITNNINVIIQE